MAKKDRISGNEAIALAIKQINPDVMPAFPITPSTEIPQYFCQYVADGAVDTEFIPVESEHSSMSAAIGASAAGAEVSVAGAGTHIEDKRRRGRSKAESRRGKN